MNTTVLARSSLMSLDNGLMSHIVSYLKPDEIGRLCLVNKQFFEAKRYFEKVLHAEIKQLEADIYSVLSPWDLPKWARKPLCQLNPWTLEDAEKVYDEVDCALVDWASCFNNTEISMVQAVLKPNMGRFLKALTTATEINTASAQPSAARRINELQQLIPALGAENRFAVALLIFKKVRKMEGGGALGPELIKLLAKIAYDLIEKAHLIGVKRLIQRIVDGRGLGRVETVLTGVVVQTITDEHYKEAIAITEVIVGTIDRAYLFINFHSILDKFCSKELYSTST